MAECEHIGAGDPQGEPLRSRLPLSDGERANVLTQIGRAFVAAGSAGIEHGAISLEHVYVQTTDGDLFVRVYGLERGPDYRQAGDAVHDLCAIASEIVGRSPPRGFLSWRDACENARWTIDECVSSLVALFPVRGGAGNAGCDEPSRRSLRTEHTRGALARARLLDRVVRHARVIAPLVAFAVVAVVASALRSERRSTPPPAARPVIVETTPVATTSAREESTGAILDLLSRDRADCPDHFLKNAELALKARSFRCIRASLYQRILDGEGDKVTREERRALKVACAALADLGCELRIDQ